MKRWPKSGLKARGRVIGGMAVSTRLLAAVIGLALWGASGNLSAQEEPHVLQREREEMSGRALHYLARQVKDGRLGEGRPRAVTALFVLAALSNGVVPGSGEVGESVAAATEWLLGQDGACLGGTEEPHADHVLVALALQQMTGIATDAETNRKLYRRSLEALQYSLEVQDKGTNPEHTGGWTPDLQTRVNDRMLTGWFLLQLHGAGLWQARVGTASRRRASAFVLASQKGEEGAKEDERGGFSVGADGLAVRSATAVGTLVLACHGESDEPLVAATRWLQRHPPHWYGPHFFETGYFASRALWRSRHLDEGQTFQHHFARLVRLLRERQESDGSFPFPPGHGEPLVAMGRGYSTAMAVLILNADRGLLPLDQ